MREQIELLAQIQLKDDILAKLKHEVSEGPSKIQAAELEVERLETEVEGQKQRLGEVKARQRECERDVEDGEERIKKSKARLLNIKSNKEYQAVLKEIEETQRANREREDQIIACMEELEGIQQDLQMKQAQVTQVHKAYEEKKAALEKQLRVAKAEIAEQEGQREAMAVSVEASVLNTYHRLKSRLGGKAVALVENATCSACNMNIPPQMYNELQRMDSLRFCPSCDRLIYWKNGNETNKDRMSE